MVKVIVILNGRVKINNFFRKIVKTQIEKKRWKIAHLAQLKRNVNIGRRLRDYIEKSES